MPYNGSGTFTLPAGNPVVTGTTISSTVNNNTNSDLANGLSNAVTRNGQSPPTANLPMGNFKLTGLAAGTTAGDSARYDELILKANLISAVLVTPNLGTPSAGVLTNCTGTAAGLTAGNVTTNANLTGGVTSVGNVATVVTNANLTGAVTSVGNASSLGSFTSAQLAAALTNETGSGSAVFGTSPTLTSATLTTPTINSAQVPTISGTAPLYMCRAWVNFNGTGTVAIRAEGNVSSITDNGTGDYTVNFTTAMPDANYAALASGVGNNNTTARFITIKNGGTYSTTAVQVYVTDVSAGSADTATVTVGIFR